MELKINNRSTSLNFILLYTFSLFLKRFGQDWLDGITLGIEIRTYKSDRQSYGRILSAFLNFPFFFF